MDLRICNVSEVWSIPAGILRFTIMEELLDWKKVQEIINLCLGCCSDGLLPVAGK